MKLQKMCQKILIILSGKKLKERLTEGKEDAILSKKLATNLY